MSYKISDGEYSRIFDESKVDERFHQGGYLNHSDLYDEIKYSPENYKDLMRHGAEYNGYVAGSEYNGDDSSDSGWRYDDDYISPFRGLSVQDIVNIKEADRIISEKRRKEDEEREEEDRVAWEVYDMLSEARKEARRKIEAMGKEEWEEHCKEISTRLEEEREFKIKKYAKSGLIDDPENADTIKLVEHLLEKYGFDYVYTKLDEMAFYKTHDWFTDKYYDEYNDEKNDLIDKEILEVYKTLKHQ
jgi:hypothetical protein